MEEIEIVRLNVKRFRRMLQTELNWPKRLIIENMLHEFEDRIAASESNGRYAEISTGNSKRSSKPFNANQKEFGMRSVRSIPRQGHFIIMESRFRKQIGYGLKIASNAIKNCSLSIRLSKWRLISTAPSNQELELRIVEYGKISTLEFPCLRTNAGAWINVDLGAEIILRATEWRPWQRKRSPQPHRSRIKFGGRKVTLRRARELRDYNVRPIWSDAVI